MRYATCCFPVAPAAAVANAAAMCEPPCTRTLCVVAPMASVEYIWNQWLQARAGQGRRSRAGVGTAWIERRACPDAKGKFAVSTTSPRSEPSQAGSRPRHASPGPSRRPPPPPPEDVEHDERHGGQVPARVHHRQQGQQAGGGHAVSHHVQHCRQQGVRVGWVPGEGRAGGGSGVSVGRAQALLLLQRCRPVQCLAATQPALACPVFRCTPIPAIQQPAPTPARPTHPSPARSTG